MVVMDLHQSMRLVPITINGYYPWSDVLNYALCDKF
jgi:hypothetical protein